MYFAILVPTPQHTHTHSDAALALQGMKPHWLAASGERLEALAERFARASRFASRFISPSVS
jgi:hypothetical protein